MSRTTTTPVLVALVALVAAGAGSATVGGVTGLAVAAGAFAAAAVVWSFRRPVAAPGQGWWKLLLGGSGLLLSLIAVVTLDADLTNAHWYVAMSLGAISLLLIAGGLVLGASARFRTS